MTDAGRRPLTRPQLRLLRRKADQIAAEMAASCLSYSPQGYLARVADSPAVRALATAFATMLRNGGEPAVIEITQEAADAFRRGSAPRATLDVKHWLAVGLDREGRGTYSLRHLEIVCADRAEAAAFAQIVMLGELARETGQPGYPMGAPMGGVC